MIILADYNLNRHALLLSGSLISEGWLEVVPIQFVTFREIGLAIDSSDRVVWRLAQTHRMLLLTANRNAKGEDSLETVMREENSPTSLPIITIGNPDRIYESQYRKYCVEKLVEIILDLEDYMGVGRLFIP
ncbi:MAG: ACP S-malonyltransferase [Cyanobacteria bacterium SBLK]|nr:ACP S-malonyltransferase [Cyanobacteria bacterium SBLK]